MNKEYGNHPKNVQKYLQIFLEEAVKYPPNYIEYKDKRHAIIKEAVKFWHLVFNLTSVNHSMKGSYLLGCNENIVKPFITECAMFITELEQYETKNKEQMKGCPEITLYYNDLFKMVNKKQIISEMLLDLEYWSSTHNFTINKQEIIQQFNSIKEGSKCSITH